MSSWESEQVSQGVDFSRVARDRLSPLAASSEPTGTRACFGLDGAGRRLHTFGLIMTDTQPTPIEPDEVLPPGTTRPPPRSAPPPPAPGIGRIQMILVGLILDALDLITLGPVGLRIGLPLGGLLAFYILGVFGFPLKRRILLSVVAGLYCALPGTSLLPLGTLLGLLMKRP